jgi:hypothetical protein
MPGGFNLAWGGAPLANAGADTTASAGTAVTSNASANTKGSYSQLIASTANDACGLLVTSGPSSTTGRWSVDIAIGGAGSEVIVAADLMFNFSGSGLAQSAMTCFVPLNIPAGTRIAARAQCQNASSPTLKVSAQLINSGFDGLGGLSASDTYGFVAASTKGTTVDPGAVANTKGSWTQLVSSCNRDIKALGICFDGGGGGGGSNQSLVDIGVGAAASEQILIPNIQQVSSNTVNYSPYGMIIFPCSIPAATRIAARAQSSSVVISQRNSTVTVYGFS